MHLKLTECILNICFEKNERLGGNNSLDTINSLPPLLLDDNEGWLGLHGSQQAEIFRLGPYFFSLEEGLEMYRFLYYIICLT